MPGKSITAMKIKALRKKSSLTQADLAARIGLSRAAISQFEAGDSKPSVETLVKLAEALGADLSELVSDALPSTGKKVVSLNNVHALGFLADMLAVDLPFVSFRARASFVELGVWIQHPDSFETLRLYVSSEQEA
jgi:transcriptional regulator with XRE-family HTH domain